MSYSDPSKLLLEIVEKCIAKDARQWLFNNLEMILKEQSVKKLYLTYTLCHVHVPKEAISFDMYGQNKTTDLLRIKMADTLEVTRIFLLNRVLEENFDFFKVKVANLIQVADTSELETFLKYLVLLPKSEEFKFAGVEALRTNISTVFDAIALNNPYPSQYFNEQQYNQMYLKAAFMQRDLSEIVGVDQMANKELSRIISDYAHERWAASREIDPEFWRPVSNHVEGVLVDDMKRLFESKNSIENRAAALVCFHSNKSDAQNLLDNYPVLKELIHKKSLTWENFKN
ncbi:EboA domain-containing protein [uncultured Croceitalea sp.]|uniref:EboA domain-containing protein n=1 Tax=uncultured Croceitalea sp. TaxID=1798908 RepID=UPI00330688BD